MHQTHTQEGYSITCEAPNWKQSNYQSTVKWRYISTMENYTAIKINELLLPKTKWLNLINGK